jgi:hypothetical protein
LICITNKRYKNKRSFLNYGPNRLIKSSDSGRVFYLDYEDLNSPENGNKIFRMISDSVTKIQKKSPVNKSVTNILEAENFILPCIYLMEDIEFNSLKTLLKLATSQENIMADIATRSALTKLQTSRMIMKTAEGYSITKSGEVHVLSIFKLHRLDLIRVELLNFKNRRKSSINYDRMSTRTFSELFLEKLGVPTG